MGLSLLFGRGRGLLVLGRGAGERGRGRESKAYDFRCCWTSRRLGWLFGVLMDYLWRK